MVPEYDRTIITARLLLRPWQRADLDGYQAWPPFKEPLLTVFNNEPRTDLELDLEWAFAHLNPTQSFWTIINDRRIIGRITLRDIVPARGTGQLGMLLGAPYVDHGFGSEALRGWLDAYFGRWQMQHLQLQVAGWNVRAQHIYERAGFVTVRHYWQTLGPAEAYAFLHEPHYAQVAPCFRWSPTAVYARWSEMHLTHANWSGLSSRPTPSL